MPALPGVPLKWYAAVLLGMSFLILLFLGLRYREAFAVLRSGRSRGAGGFRPVETRHASRPLVSGALAEARRRSDWLSGVVKEHEGPQVARRAHITVTSIADGAVFETHGDGDGRFELGPLPDGHYALELDARGFLSRTATVSVPHDGSLDGCVYLLGSLRGVLRDVLMNALSPVLGALTWGRDTPREMARTLLASEHPRRDELSDLTELVEQAWFSADGPTAESLERASHLVGGQEESE
jgi:hypothetical protein